MPEAGSKTRVLIYSDCTFFGGCENMPANLLNSREICGEFDVFFAYRDSREYSAGLTARVKTDARLLPVRIPAAEAFRTALERKGFRGISTGLRSAGVFLALKYIFALYAAAVLFFLFRRVKPDILHINNGGYPGAYSCVSAVLAARAAGIKHVVFVVNNIAVPYTRFTRRLEKGIDRLLTDKVEVFITGSRYAGARLREVLRVPRERTVNIPNGIAVRQVKESRAAVLARLGLSGNPVILGNVAVLEARKGHKYLLLALARVKERFPRFSEVFLLIEGVGPERGNLERQAKELGIAANVRFLGREKNIFDVMRAFDVFILPSAGYEDFPNVILEAMGLGKPVIGTRVAGIPEQIAEGETGLLVEPSDPQALAEAILKMLTDEPRRVEMGRRGRERFEAGFSCEKAVESYAALYRRLTAAQAQSGKTA
jgi:glycosyltransferase involved in cell wall biosynthesis